MFCSLCSLSGLIEQPDGVLESSLTTGVAADDLVKRSLPTHHFGNHPLARAGEIEVIAAVPRRYSSYLTLNPRIPQACDGSTCSECKNMTGTVGQRIA